LVEEQGKIQENNIQQKTNTTDITQIVIQNYSAILINDINEVVNYLRVLPKYSHIYLIDNTNIYQYQNYFNNRVTIIKSQNKREISGFIYTDMFSKRLTNLVFNEHTQDIKNMVSLLVNLDQEFSFGPGGLLSIENFWKNLNSIIENPDLTSLRDLCKGLPVVIVASGPSLTKDINLLKKYQNKCVIVACGTSSQALYKNNIIPDFCVTIDPFPLMKECILPYITEKTILISNTVGDINLINEFKGKKVFFFSQGALSAASDMVQYLEIKEAILSSATVSTAALSLVLYMNADQVIFLGQDMCFSGDNQDKYYADDINGGTMNQIVDIEGLDGKIYKTLSAYKEVSDYFNLYVPNLVAKGKNIINCSDGVGIKDATHILFQEVIDKYLKEDVYLPDIKRNKIIDKAKILSKMCLIKNEIDYLLKYLDVYKKYVDNLIESKIEYKFIENDINQFIDNIKDKSMAYNYCSGVLNWLWFLMISTSQIEEKQKGLIFVGNMLNKLLGLIDEQIGIMSLDNGNEGSNGDGNCGS
jgi:hypothetical protein